MNFFFALLLVPLWLCQPAVPAQAAETPAPASLVSIYFENDLFTGTDQNYTNGVKLTTISPNITLEILPRWLLGHLHRLPILSENAAGETHQAEFSLGQAMFTPGDIARSDLIENDRPYGGWSYMGLAYHHKYQADQTLSRLDSVEVQIGVVGPDSFADETQKFVHSLRNLQRPNGWQHQLDNEPGLVAAFERKWLYHPEFPTPWGVDLISHGGLALGNVATYINGGFEIRAGRNIPKSFGVSLIRPAGSTNLTPPCRPSLYTFAAVNGKAVFRDIFLDGSTFGHSHSVNKKPLVADLAAGLAISYKNFMASISQVLRTAEFEEQQDSHSFGAVSISLSIPF